MRTLILGLAVVVTLIVAACQPPTDSPDPLYALFAEEWSFRLQEDPLFATAVGRHEYNDRLPAVGLADHERRGRFWQSLVERLEALDRSGLSEEDRINYDLFRGQLQDRLFELEFRAHLIPITAETGFHTAFARLPDRVPLLTTADYENYIARLRSFPRYADQHLELMREGISQGCVLPRVVLEGYESTITTHIVSDPSESVFYAPFTDFPASVSAADHRRLLHEGREAIATRVIPGYRGFLEFMTQEYVPNTRSTLGAFELPNGRDYYEYLIRHHTTLNVTAQEVHRIGLDEVARIRGEMQQVIDEVGFAGDFNTFLEFLRTDPRFFVESPEDLLKEAAFIAKRMDGQLPRLFKTLPRLPYGVAPVPDHIAPKYTAGRYVGAPLGGTQPGYYWVNTFALDSRPLWALTALTLHEAVPGHHLQNALRQELENLPPFRRFSGINAYGEGWGLYSEWLGIEAGMYDDPYEHFGRLTYEMWRACRLVVDTGLHAFGWSRQQALDYLAANTALSRHEIRTETDRYISWPGQALAYKMGELKIRELRRRAEMALGERFDVREFHDRILLNGPLPLPLLEQQVEAYIEASLGKTV